MVDVKPIDQIITKWSTNAGAASQYYATGALAAGNKWAANAGQAGANWSAGVQEAVANNRFANGIAAAGPTGYTTGIQTKGVTRYAGGITAGKTAYQQGMQAVVATLQGVQLPARQPRGSPGNLQRVAAIDTALHTLRTG